MATIEEKSGIFLKALVKSHFKKSKEIGSLIGTSNSSWNNYQLGKILPPADALAKICSLFEIHPLVYYMALYDPEERVLGADTLFDLGNIINHYRNVIDGSSRFPSHLAHIEHGTLEDRLATIPGYLGRAEGFKAGPPVMMKVSK